MILTGNKNDYIVRQREDDLRPFVVRPAYHPDPYPLLDIRDLSEWQKPRTLIVAGVGALVLVALAALVIFIPHFL